MGSGGGGIDKRSSTLIFSTPYNSFDRLTLEKSPILYSETVTVVRTFVCLYSGPFQVMNSFLSYTPNNRWELSSPFRRPFLDIGSGSQELFMPGIGVERVEAKVHCNPIGVATIAVK